MVVGAGTELLNGHVNAIVVHDLDRARARAAKADAALARGELWGPLHGKISGARDRLLWRALLGALNLTQVNGFVEIRRPYDCQGEQRRRGLADDER